jgi:hypothetical protein
MYPTIYDAQMAGVTLISTELRTSYDHKSDGNGEKDRLLVAL